MYIYIYIYTQLCEKHNKNLSLKAVHNENAHSYTKWNTCLFIHSFFYQIFISSCTMPEMDLWPWYASVNKIKNPTLHVESHKTPLKKDVNRPLLPKILIYWQFQYNFWNLPKMFTIFFFSQNHPHVLKKKTQNTNLYTYSSFSSVQSFSCVWLFVTP